MMDLFGMEDCTNNDFFGKSTADSLIDMAKEDTEEHFLSHYKEADNLGPETIVNIVMACTHLSLDTLTLLCHDIFGIGGGHPRYTVYSRKVMELLDSLVSAQREDVLDYILSLNYFKTSRVNDVLSEAIGAGKVAVVERLLQLDYPFPLTESLKLHWSKLDNGDPALDACVRLLAQYFLPGAWRQHCATPYHPQLSTKEGLRSLCPNFLCYLIEKGELKPSRINAILEELETSASALSCGANFDYGFQRNPIPQTGIEKILLSLFTHYPQYLNRKKSRSLLACLALQPQPNEELYQLARNLGGKTLVITNLYGQDFFSLTGLLSRWRSVMPAGLSPIFSREIDCDNVDPYYLVLEVDFTKSTSVFLSNVALALLEKRHEHPDSFRFALGPHGFLSGENRESLLEHLREDSIFDSPTAQQDYRQALAILGGK